MINYKEKYLKYKKKYLKIKKMFGGSGSGMPHKKKDLEEDPLKIGNFNSPGAEKKIKEEIEKKIKEEIEEDNEKLAEMEDAVNSANKKEAEKNKLYDKIQAEKNKLYDKIKIQEEKELPAFEFLSRLKKGTVEYPNNSNSEENNNYLLVGSGILFATITSVILLLK